MGNKGRASRARDVRLPNLILIILVNTGLEADLNSGLGADLKKNRILVIWTIFRPLGKHTG
jgi:hypothetical protein